MSVAERAGVMPEEQSDPLSPVDLAAGAYIESFEDPLVRAALSGAVAALSNRALQMRAACEERRELLRAFHDACCLAGSLGEFATVIRENMGRLEEADQRIQMLENRLRGLVI